MAERATPRQPAYLAAAGLAVFAVLSLTACSSEAEDTLYEGFKCSRVASQLGRAKDADNAMENVREAALEVEKSVPPDQRARHAMRATERFQDDVPLHKLSTAGKRELLSSIYGSSTCQRLYMDPSLVRRTPRNK